MNKATKMLSGDTVLVHPNQPGVTHIVEVLENGVSYAHDSREDEGYWLGGRELAAEHVAMYLGMGWQVAS